MRTCYTFEGSIYQVSSSLLPVWPHEVGVGAVALAAHRGRVQPLQDLVQLALDRAAVGHDDTDEDIESDMQAMLL